MWIETPEPHSMIVRHVSQLPLQRVPEVEVVESPLTQAIFLHSLSTFEGPPPIAITPTALAAVEVSSIMVVEEAVLVPAPLLLEVYAGQWRPSAVVLREMCAAEPVIGPIEMALLRQ